MHDPPSPSACALRVEAQGAWRAVCPRFPGGARGEARGGELRTPRRRATSLVVHVLLLLLSVVLLLMVHLLVMVLVLLLLLVLVVVLLVHVPGVQTPVQSTPRLVGHRARDRPVGGGPTAGSLVRAPTPTPTPAPALLLQSPTPSRPLPCKTSP